MSRAIFGRCKALCAYVRMVLATLYVIFFAGHFDAIIVDQVSVCLPILWLFRRKTIFYCHFPDKLLCVERSLPFKKFYRFFLDLAEELSLLFANTILVNSQFTRDIFYRSFRILRRFNTNTFVLYPSVELAKLDSTQAAESYPFPFFVSLNRYERKKNIGLAIKAFRLFREQRPGTDARLIIAGGYDPQLPENIEHYAFLEELARQEGVHDRVIFLRNVDDQVRKMLLKQAQAVLYTPENEHFGIVPIESNRPAITARPPSSSSRPTSLYLGPSYLSRTRSPWRWILWRTLASL